MHNLLKRQIKRHFRIDELIPEVVKSFLKDIDDAYIASDNDRLMLERSLDLSSHELMQANQEIRHNEEQLHTLINAMPDIICLKDGVGRWLEANDFYLQLLLLDGVNYKGKKDSELADYSPYYSNIFLEAEKSDEKTWLSRKITRKEQTIPRPERINLIFDIIIVPLFYHDGKRKGIVLIGRDITDRKMAEDALQREMRFTKTIIESSPAFFVAIKKDGNIVLINHSMTSALGYTEDEVIGKDFLSTFIPENDWETLIEIFKKVCKMNLPTANENYILKKDGQKLLIEWHGIPIRSEKREFEYFLGVGLDVTEKKKLELQLNQARKMEAVGTLAGGIAHNFNNLLTGMQGYISLILMDIDSKNPHYKMLKSIEEQIQSGARLTRQILGFARGGNYEVKPININEIIEKTATMFGHTKKEVVIQKKFDNNLWTVEIDQGQIEQALLNLFVNAWQAMPRGGSLFLETTNIILQESFTRLYYCNPGKYVKITVTDTGIGIDDEKKERIFEPFYTTKEVGHGTGLGLASVYGIIKSHGGIIDVKSEKGQGTTFSIYLPATEKKTEKLANKSETVQMGTGTILLVDDEQVIADVTSKLIANLGYNVIVARSGMEAINIYKEKRSRIDLIILDIVMPGMSGRETFEALSKINPEIKVILSSGYTLDENAQKLLKQGCCAFIQKPFTIHELSTKVWDALKKQ